jgi:acetyl-CoA synthetase
MTADTVSPADPTFPVPARLLAGKPTPHVTSFDQYKAMWEQSVKDPQTFFGNVSSMVPPLSQCMAY